MEIMVFAQFVQRTDNFSRFFASRLPNGRLFFGRIAPLRSCIEVIADFDERLDWGRDAGSVTANVESRARVGAEDFLEMGRGKVGIRTRLSSWLYV